MSKAIERGINVDLISLGDKGEMVVLDYELLKLVSGGGAVNVGSDKGINVLLCNPTVNLGCGPSSGGTGGTGSGGTGSGGTGSGGTGSGGTGSGGTGSGGTGSGGTGTAPGGDGTSDHKPADPPVIHNSDD